jgi:hypothetical protein
MLALSDIFGARREWIDFALWRARSIAYSAKDAFDEGFLDQRITLLDGGSANEEDIQILFVIGRELVVGGRRIGKDVATLLGQKVYATRQEATAWYRHNCGVRLNSQRDETN